MAAKSTWKGYLKLSLVSIPVKAYSVNAGDGSPIRLNQLHAECKSRIQNIKTCPIHGKVPNDEIVSGYEFVKDQYVLIDTAELSKLRSDDQKAVTIREFIAPDALDPIYWNGTTLFLLPDGPIGQRPYSLLHAGMVEQQRFAIATVVWHGKEQIVLIRPMGELLAMCVLSYDHEIAKPNTLESEVVKVEQVPEEVDLVRTLIKAATKTTFDFTKYTDVYTVKLTELIEMKVAGKEIVAAPAQEHTHVINLFDALKQSVELARQKGELPPYEATSQDASTQTPKDEPPPVAPPAPIQVSAAEPPAEPPPIMAPSKKRRTPQRKKKSS